MPQPPQLPPQQPRPPGAPTALAGLRIVDFSHFIAGPLATMFLGDMGAEVIKIEKTGRGDDFRGFGVQKDGMGPPFVWTNRNKKSIAIDLTTAEGQDIARALIATADVVVENFSADVMSKFGLDYESLKAANPRLVYCAVSAYGRTGPFAGRLGFDPIAQAESGFMSLTGDPDQDPLRSGPAIMDMSTAMMACNAVLGGLMARERYNEGQYVEVSLFDTATLMSGFHAIAYLMSGVVPPRFGNSSRDSAPTDVFYGSDGPFYLACANDRSFHRLARDVIGRPDLADNPDFAAMLPRTANKDKLKDILTPIFKTQTRAEWLALMQPLGVPAGAVRSLDEVFAAPEVLERNRVSQIPAASGNGVVPNIAPPFAFGATPTTDPIAAPLLGQHTAEVLGDLLGYDAERISQLTQAGIVQGSN
jgi:crotonobetainyl-CoA:carnitine CoA-transferase CaiB-like acyl-CoA transferase